MHAQHASIVTSLQLYDPSSLQILQWNKQLFGRRKLPKVCTWQRIPLCKVIVEFAHGKFKTVRIFVR
jgi:hypothetical protein